MRPRSGFTLVELLVVITILAILSVVGLTAYSGVQKNARDAKRKDDLRAVKVALELYYQKNNRYPCPGDNVWKSSASGGSWITDEDFAGCTDTQKNLDSSYISRMPTDPLNSGPGTVWNNLETGYYYGYRGYHSALCAAKKGQFFILVALLENKNDANRNGLRLVKDCNGAAITGPGWDNAYVITSDD